MDKKHSLLDKVETYIVKNRQRCKSLELTIELKQKHDMNSLTAAPNIHTHACGGHKWMKLPLVKQ